MELALYDVYKQSLALEITSHMSLGPRPQQVYLGCSFPWVNVAPHEWRAGIRTTSASQLPAASSLEHHEKQERSSHLPFMKASSPCALKSSGTPVSLYSSFNATSYSFLFPMLPAATRNRTGSWKVDLIGAESRMNRMTAKERLENGRGRGAQRAWWMHTGIQLNSRKTFWSSIAQKRNCSWQSLVACFKIASREDFKGPQHQKMMFELMNRLTHLNWSSTEIPCKCIQLLCANFKIVSVRTHIHIHIHVEQRTIWVREN